MTDAASPLPGGARDDDGPTFREPWEAQAFAITLALHERGLFSWSEWSRALAAQIAAAPADEQSADCYYRHWLTALEQLVTVRGASSSEELMRYRRAWEHAVERTPHGEPIDLEPGDLGK